MRRRLAANAATAAAGYWLAAAAAAADREHVAATRGSSAARGRRRHARRGRRCCRRCRGGGERRRGRGRGRFGASAPASPPSTPLRPTASHRTVKIQACLLLVAARHRAHHQRLPARRRCSATARRSPPLCYASACLLPPPAHVYLRFLHFQHPFHYSKRLPAVLPLCGAAHEGRRCGTVSPAPRLRGPPAQPPCAVSFQKAIQIMVAQLWERCRAAEGWQARRRVLPVAAADGQLAAPVDRRLTARWRPCSPPSLIHSAPNRFSRAKYKAGRAKTGRLGRIFARRRPRNGVLAAEHCPYLPAASPSPDPLAAFLMLSGARIYKNYRVTRLGRVRKDIDQNRVLDVRAAPPL